MVAALDRNEVVYPYAKANIYPGSSRNRRVQHPGSVGRTPGWMIPYTARFPEHPNTIRLKALRADAEAVNGRSVDFVLRGGTLFTAPSALENLARTQEPNEAGQGGIPGHARIGGRIQRRKEPARGDSISARLCVRSHERRIGQVPTFPPCNKRDR